VTCLFRPIAQRELTAVAVRSHQSPEPLHGKRVPDLEMRVFAGAF
jgi:hypothetical protein